MGLPLSVLRSIPEPVCTSNMGLRLLKKAGFPHPALGKGIVIAASCCMQQSIDNKVLHKEHGVQLIAEGSSGQRRLHDSQAVHGS